MIQTCISSSKHVDTAGNVAVPLMPKLSEIYKRRNGSDKRPELITPVTSATNM
jgi:hypothetical protein